MIYVLGDSHIELFKGVPDVQLFGWQRLMYQVTYEGLNFPFTPGTTYREKIIQPKSPFLFMFGEIDCRMYLTDKTNADLERLSEDYVCCIMKFNKLYSISTKFIIASITPPTDVVIPAKYINKTYYSGTIERRIEVTKFMNKEIKKRSKYFLDIYNHYSDSTGKLRGDISDGWTHIKSDYNDYAVKKLMEIINK
jgi:hypothetical protein